MDDQVSSVLNSPGPSLTLLVGENGAGKSFRLAELAEQLSARERVIAIGNTPFSRFVRRRNERYRPITTSVGKGYVAEVFKRSLMTDSKDLPRSARLIAQSMDYLGFSPFLGLWVKVINRSRGSDTTILRMHGVPEDDANELLRFLTEADLPSPLWIDMFEATDTRYIETLLKIMRYSSALKQARIVDGISFYLSSKEPGVEFKLSDASSGELSLLATYAHLATNISERAIILVDEPENSLHPRWQMDYCKRIFDQFGYYEPRLVIATHSPQIVQGAERSGIKTHIVKLPVDQIAAQPLTKSIEGTMFEAFGVLSPASHYLSEKVTYLLNELVLQRDSADATKTKLRSMINLSVDDAQKEFLERAVDLASTIVKELDHGSATT
jgi:predicted ATPase